MSQNKVGGAYFRHVLPPAFLVCRLCDDGHCAWYKELPCCTFGLQLWKMSIMVLQKPGLKKLRFITPAGPEELTLQALSPEQRDYRVFIDRL